MALGFDLGLRLQTAWIFISPFPLPTAGTVYMTLYLIRISLMAGGRSAVLLGPAAMTDREDNRLGTVSLVIVHDTVPQAQIDTAPPAASNSDSKESTRSKLHVGRPSVSA